MTCARVSPRLPGSAPDPRAAPVGSSPCAPVTWSPGSCWSGCSRRGTLFLLSAILPGFDVDNAGSALVAAALIGLVNALVWPVLIGSRCRSRC